MIIITPKKMKSKGFYLEIKNANGELFKHFYNSKHGAKRAWKNFEKQILMGKVKFVE